MPLYSREIWAVIPARGGSKSIPYKNLVKVSNQTLIERTVIAGRGSELLSRMFVSTEDEKIASHCRHLDVEIHNRPGCLAKDDTPIDLVLRQFLKDIADKEGIYPLAIVLLQPTSIFIRPQDIDECIKPFLDDDSWNSVQTVTLCAHNAHAHNQRILLEEGISFAFPNERKQNYNKQRKPKHYLFGNVVATRTIAILSGAGVFAEPSYGIEIPNLYAFDLDNAVDLALAEQVANLV